VEGEYRRRVRTTILMQHPLLAPAFAWRHAGCKLNNVGIVYTMWSNLKKTASMEVGQVRVFVCVCSRLTRAVVWAVL